MASRKQSDFSVVLCGEECAVPDTTVFEDDPKWSRSLPVGMLAGDALSVLLGDTPAPLPICMQQGSRVDRPCGPFSLPPASHAHVWGRTLKHDYLDTFPARILSLALSGLGREMAGVFKMGGQDKNLQSFEAIY